MLEKLIVGHEFRTFASLWNSRIPYDVYTRQSPNSDPIQNSSVHTRTLKLSVLCLYLSLSFTVSTTLKLDFRAFLK